MCFVATQLKIDVYSRTSYIHPNIEFIANLSFNWDSWPFLDVEGHIFINNSPFSTPTGNIAKVPCKYTISCDLFHCFPILRYF